MRPCRHRPFGLYAAKFWRCCRVLGSRGGKPSNLRRMAWAGCPLGFLGWRTRQDGGGCRSGTAGGSRCGIRGQRGHPADSSIVFAPWEASGGHSAMGDLPFNRMVRRGEPKGEFLQRSARHRRKNLLAGWLCTLPSFDTAGRVPERAAAA